MCLDGRTWSWGAFPVVSLGDPAQVLVPLTYITENRTQLPIPWLALLVKTVSGRSCIWPAMSRGQKICFLKLRLSITATLKKKSVPSKCLISWHIICLCHFVCWNVGTADSFMKGEFTVQLPNHQALEGWGWNIVWLLVFWEFLYWATLKVDVCHHEEQKGYWLHPQQEIRQNNPDNL